jgi:tetratricopeptide (TPR) repeat protein
LGDVRGVPDVVELALARSYRRVNRRTVILAGAGSTVVFSGLFLVLWTSWAVGHERPVTDPRISMVIFPFRASGGDAQGYGEGLADLLTATLDGTPGVRVSDPASTWRQLRPEKGAPALAPNPDQALRLSRLAGVRRYVTGNVVIAGSSLDASVRIYSTETGESLATATATAHQDSIPNAVHRMAIDLLAEIWERDRLPTVPEIDRFATDNLDALKAYLEAKNLARQGLWAAALPPIERALALDSTFALAYLEHFNIRSMLSYMNAEPVIGLRPLIEKAMQYRERLTPRNRLHIEAARAMDDTDGSEAAFLYERILSIDPFDLDALKGIAFTYLRDGWQLGKTTEDVIAAFDRVLAVDSTNVVALTTRARLATYSADPADLQRELSLLRSADTTSAYAQATLGALEVLLASEQTTDSILEALANESVPIVLTVARELRAHRPEIAERYYELLMASDKPVTHRGIGSGARAQLWIAEGRLAAVDSLLAAGEFQAPMMINRHFVAAQLAGVGSPPISNRAIADLSAYLPADSLNYYFYDRPAWPTGWAVGAYHATFGDTAEARAWQRALESLPGGGTPFDYRVALSSDIEARVAARRGDMVAAERHARRALENWQIHTNDVMHDWAELGMRFQLAEVLREQGADDQAEWYYRSFTPPHGWLGFYTARASFELGRITEARADRREAMTHYLRAARLWEHGEPEVVGAWLGRAQEGIARLRSELTKDRASPADRLDLSRGPSGSRPAG